MLRTLNIQVGAELQVQANHLHVQERVCAIPEQVPRDERRAGGRGEADGARRI